MGYHRGSVLTGKSIELRVVVTDDAGNLIDADSIPSLYLYGPDETVLKIGLFFMAYVTASLFMAPQILCDFMVDIVQQSDHDGFLLFTTQFNSNHRYICSGAWLNESEGHSIR